MLSWQSFGVMTYFDVMANFLHHHIFLTSSRTFQRYDVFFMRWRVSHIMIYIWHHDELFEVMTHFSTYFWRHDELSNVMTYFWSHDALFDVIKYFERHDDEPFHVITYFWCHDTNFRCHDLILTSLLIFDVMTYFWRHDVTLTNFSRIFDVMTNFVAS